MPINELEEYLATRMANQFLEKINDAWSLEWDSDHVDQQLYDQLKNNVLVPKTKYQEMEEKFGLPKKGKKNI